MLTSILADGTKVLAQKIDREKRPFYCPECNSETVLHKGMIKIPHFAHKPPVSCQYGTGESEAHHKCKQEIYNCLLKDKTSVTVCELEKDLGKVRPDVYFESNNHKIAIEVQISNLSMEQIIYRTEQYNRLNVGVLWLPVFTDTLYNDSAVHREKYFAPRQWEKWLHATYFGRVYYWLCDLDVLPVHFGKVMLDNPGCEFLDIPGYSYTSKRYREPVQGTIANILYDFDTVFRQQWEGGKILVPNCKILLDNQKKWWK